MLSAVATVLLPWSVVGGRLTITGMAYGEGQLLLCLLAAAALTSSYTLLRELEAPRRPNQRHKLNPGNRQRGPLWPTGLLSLGAALTASWLAVDLSQAVNTISEVMALLPAESQGLLDADTRPSVGPGAWVANAMTWLACAAVATATRMDRRTR